MEGCHDRDKLCNARVPAMYFHMTRVRLECACENFDESGLARPIGAHQGHDLTASDTQRRIAQGDDGTELFGNACGVQDRCLSVGFSHRIQIAFMEQ